MARTTVTLVKDIITTELTDPIIESYVDGANVFVTTQLDGKSLTDATLAEIERWIAAHMIAVSKEQQIKEAGAGGAEVKYTGYWSYGLLATNYGQMAISLDSSGTLSSISKGKSKAWTIAIEGE